MCQLFGLRIRARQILIAGGATFEDLGLEQENIKARGVAMQCRITTENVERDFAPDTGTLAVYGPFMVDGKHTSESNDAFSQRLQAQNSAWGVRDSTAIAELAAAKFGLEMIAREAMPANNFVLVFRRKAA